MSHQEQEQWPLLTEKRQQSLYSNESHVSPDQVQDFRTEESEYQHDLHHPYQIEIETGEAPPPPSPPKKKKQSLMSQIDVNAAQFAARMAVMLAVSSLFVLIRSDTYHYPDGMWVLVSVLFVSWFPSLDAASVIEKITQRLIGTFVGAFFGLSCGFLSLWAFTTRNHQATFLFTCMLVFNFGIIFFAGQAQVGSVKVIRRFAYATVLCVLTFCICMLPFGLDEDPKWELGVYRVINVVVGCLLGAVGSMVVCPKSTTDVLHEKTARQVKLAGEASEALLHTASDFFAGRIQVNRLADELLHSPLESAIRWKLMRSSSSRLSDDSSHDGLAKSDIALKKYEDAIADWRVTKALFPLTHYDPFSLSIHESTGEDKEAQTEIARTLARALRIQTTIVVLDGMVRNDADYGFQEEQLLQFAEAGTLIRRMLTLPLEKTKSDNAARKLFGLLEETRQSVLKMSLAVSDKNEHLEPIRSQGIQEFKDDLLYGSSDVFQSSRTEFDDNGRGIPKNTTHRNDNSLFFLQLVEHLILRSLRLYQAWKHVDANSHRRRNRRGKSPSHPKKMMQV